MTQIQHELKALQQATRVSDALSLVDYFEDERFIYIVTKKPKQTLLAHLMASK